MIIFIIGSEGFIGSHCVDFFLSQNHQVIGCDLLDVKSPRYSYYKISRLEPDFTEIFIRNQFDVCINAGGSGSVPASIAHPLGDFEANTGDTFKVLESIRKYNSTCRYINLSSAAVYGNPSILPISETHAVNALSPYGWHKYYSELICKEYSALYGIHTCSVRPFSVYGPRLRKQLFWDLYQKTRNGSRIELFGTGNESRDFIYVKDLVKALDLIIQKAAMKGEVINIASGMEITIRQASEIFLAYLRPGFELHFNGIVREGDPLNWRADVSTLNKIGFSSETSLTEGLLQVAQWLQEKD